MVEKYIELNLNDEKSGRVAEVLGNKTCKKILSLLSEEELSENDISKRLKIPLNTVDYNIKKLLDAGFLEKSNNFFWSVKGKRIPIYRLANKKIIISTKTSFKGLLSSVLAGGLIFGGIKTLLNYAALHSPQVLSMTEQEGMLDTAASAVAESAGAMGSISIWNNVLIWVLAGVAIGILGYFILKKVNFLKGGKNKI